MQQKSSNSGKKGNGNNRDWYDDLVNHDMELDDHHNTNGNHWDKMDMEETNDTQVEYGQLLADTISYGQSLQAEFRDDPRREIGKALNDAFALLAYQDPLNEKEVSHRLDVSGRISVAEELNSAILCKCQLTTELAISLRRFCSITW